MQTLTPEQEAEQKRLETEGNKPIAEAAPANIFIQKILGKASNPDDGKGKGKGTKAKPADGDGSGSGGGDNLEDDDGKKKGEGEDDDAGRKKGKTAEANRAFDEEVLGKAIADNLAPHLTKRGKEKDDDKAGDGKGDDEIKDPAEKRRVEVLFHMEQMPEFADKYKGIRERYAETKKAALAEALAYKKQWEEEHPGQKFDEDDEQHADALDAIDAKVAYPDDEDFTEALADLRATKKFEEKSKKLDERVSEVERGDRARREEKKIRKAAVEAGGEYWKELGEEFAEVIGENGEINQEALDAIKESDPIKHQIVVGAADAVENTAAALYALDNDLAAFDPKNIVHRNINAFAHERENAMLARPKQNRMSEGKLFVSRKEYSEMTEAQRQKHWTFTTDDLIYMATRRIAKKAKEDLEAEENKFTARAKARGLLKDDETQPGKKRQTKPLDDDALELEDDGEKPASPSSAASPKSAAAKGGKGTAQQNPAERFVAKL